MQNVENRSGTSTRSLDLVKTATVLSYVNTISLLLLLRQYTKHSTIKHANVGAAMAHNISECGSNHIKISSGYVIWVVWVLKTRK